MAPKWIKHKAKKSVYLEKVPYCSPLVQPRLSTKYPSSIPQPHKPPGAMLSARDSPFQAHSSVLRGQGLGGQMSLLLSYSWGNRVWRGFVTAQSYTVSKQKDKNLKPSLPDSNTYFLSPTLGQWIRNCWASWEVHGVIRGQLRNVIQHYPIGRRQENFFFSQK